MTDTRRHLPFSAIVGQEKLKTAYLANLVSPMIGGLLISGPKGTGKSTIVHSIDGILPDIEVVEGCRFGCDPQAPVRFCPHCRERPQPRSLTVPVRIINLPLSCTEDRLIGSIDVEKLLTDGRREVQPGILARANRNILYVDEVNLLPDHLVDDILDAAASHWNTIEREGVSFSHATEFVLVGSMNPEEGELRPQILDRFPLCVRMESIRDTTGRAEIVRRNLLFEKDPDGLVRLFAAEEAALKRLLVEARERAGGITLGESWLVGIAASCAELKVDGQRPDIVIVKTARAIAALAGRERLEREDVLMAADLALNHRTRDGGLLDPPDAREIREVFARNLDGSGGGGPYPGTGSGTSGRDSGSGGGTGGRPSAGGGAGGASDGGRAVTRPAWDDSLDLGKVRKETGAFLRFAPGILPGEGSDARNVDPYGTTAGSDAPAGPGAADGGVPRIHAEGPRGKKD